MKNKKIITIVFFLTSLFAMLPLQVAASEFNFAVIPMIPENQIDKSKTYFDLKMNQGAEQELAVVLRNDTSKDVTIETTINSATTNSNGVVEYDLNQVAPDKSLQFNIKELAVTAPEVLIPAGKEVTTKIQVKMPKETFNGVLAGGITFKEKEVAGTTNASSDESGMAIQNKYSYVVAILIRQNQEVVLPDLVLHQVGAAQVNARNVIKANLQNPEAAYLNNLQIAAEITKKGSAKVLYTATTEDMQMAPNSNFSYPIALNGQPLEAGDYRLKIVAHGTKDEAGAFEVKNQDGETIKFGQRWELTKDFSITSTEAKEFNKADVTIVKSYTWIYLLIGVLLLLIVIILLFLLLKKQKKAEEEPKA